MKQTSILAWSARGFLAALFVASCTRNESESDYDNFRADVIACEEAVARLDACCPSFQTTLRCGFGYSHYESGSDGCLGPGSVQHFESWPGLNAGETSCIQRTPCDVLRDTGVCDRAREATDYRYRSDSQSSVGFYGDRNSSGSSDRTTHPAVCP